MQTVRREEGRRQRAAEGIAIYEIPGVCVGGREWESIRCRDIKHHALLRKLEYILVRGSKIYRRRDGRVRRRRR